MSHLTYTNYPGMGQLLSNKNKYSQAVRIGDKIECSGQGGWNPTIGTFPPSVPHQIAQAFSNIDLSLRTAGGKGWEQVYKVTSYHVGFDEEAHEAMVRGFEEWMPGHRPIWPELGVAKLGAEVVAHVPE
ncbi:putative L-PSP endoribonuclease family protein [Aspergillus crustosus]